MKNNNLIGRMCSVRKAFSDEIKFSWEIVWYGPPDWFFKSSSTVDILLKDWTIEDWVPLYYVNIKK